MRSLSPLPYALLLCALLTACPAEDPDPVPVDDVDAGDPEQDAGSTEDAGVDGGEVQDAGLKFAVISRSPAHEELGVKVDAGISAVFNAAADPASLLSSSFTLSSSVTGPIDGTVTYDATSRTAAFTPSSWLPYDEQLTATLTTVVRDEHGAPLGMNEVWTFTTEPLVKTDVVAPSVVATTPDAGALGVAVGASVAVQFSEEVQPGSVTSGAFWIARISPFGNTPVAGSVAYDTATKTATFTPSTAFAAGATYEVTISSSVKDLAGNALTRHSFVFGTEADVVAPVIASTDPADGTTDVSTLATAVLIRFSEPIVPSSLYDGGLSFTSYVPFDGGLLEDGGVVDAGVAIPLDGVITYDERNLTAAFVPAFAFEPGATIVGTVSDQVRDLAGLTLAAPVTFGFSTETHADAPRVVSVVPPVNARLVPRYGVVKITFDRDLDAATVNTANFVISGQSTAVSYDSSTRTVTLTPPNFFPAAASVTVTVRDVKDGSGASMTRPFSWTFRTVGDPVKLSVDTLPEVTDLSAAGSSSGLMAMWFAKTGTRTRAQWALRTAAGWTAAGTFAQTSTIDPPTVHSLGNRFGAAHGLEVINPKFSVFQDGAWTLTTGYQNGDLGVLGGTAINITSNGSVDAYRLLDGSTDWLGPTPIANQGDGVLVASAGATVGVTYKVPTTSGGCRLAFRRYDGTTWSFESTAATLATACSGVQTRFSGNSFTYALSYTAGGSAGAAVYNGTSDSWTSKTLGAAESESAVVLGYDTEFAIFFRDAGTLKSAYWQNAQWSNVTAVGNHPTAVSRSVAGPAGYLLLRGSSTGQLLAVVVANGVASSSTLKTPSSTTAVTPVAVTPKTGGFVVIYDDGGTLFMRAYENGAWGGERRLNVNGSARSAVLIDGPAPLVIHSDAGELLMRTHQGGTALSTAELIPTGTLRGSSTAPSAATTSDSRMLVTWTQDVGSERRCFIRFFDGAVWSAASKLDVRLAADETCVTATNSRVFVVAWIGPDATAGGDRVHAANWSPGGGLEIPNVIGPAHASDLRVASGGNDIALTWASSVTAGGGAGSVLMSTTTDGRSWTAPATQQAASSVVYEPYEFAGSAAGYILSATAFGSTNHPTRTSTGANATTVSSMARVAAGPSSFAAVDSTSTTGALYRSTGAGAFAQLLLGVTGTSSAVAPFGDEFRVVLNGSTWLTSGTSLRAVSPVQQWTTGEVALRCDGIGCAMFGRQHPNYTELQSHYSSGSGMIVLGTIVPNARAPQLQYAGGRYGLSYLDRDDAKDADEAFWIHE